MAVKHKIHDSHGKLVEVELTPRKAVRKFCLECMCFVTQAVVDCTSPNCPLFPFRTGNAHSVDPKRRKEMSDAIKKRFGG